MTLYNLDIEGNVVTSFERLCTIKSLFSLINLGTYIQH